jgi:hypothetical protein
MKTNRTESVIELLMLVFASFIYAIVVLLISVLALVFVSINTGNSYAAEFMSSNYLYYSHAVLWLITIAVMIYRSSKSRTD